MPRLIGINGLKRSGKDTTAKLVAEQDPGVVIRRAFADKLKIMAARALGFERNNEALVELMDSMKETALFHIRYDDPQNPADAHMTIKSTAHDLTGRQYLQWFGEHARTVFGDTFWIDQVLPRTDDVYRDSDLFGSSASAVSSALKRMHGQFDVLTVTDVRYSNEAERILNLGGEVWEVTRPGCASDGHSTEIPLAPELVTVKIKNDGAVDDLRAKVGGLL